MSNQNSYDRAIKEQWMTVPCSRCGAGVGVMCLSPSGQINYNVWTWHKARRMAAGDVMPSNAKILTAMGVSTRKSRK